MFAIGVENQLAYGITMLAGGALALALGWACCLKAKLEPRLPLLATVLLPLFTVFFAHLLYCLADVEYTLNSYSPAYFFMFWRGGYMVYGGLAGAALCLALLGGRERARLWELYAPSAAWMIAVFRVGEGLLGQGYGEYWYDESALCRFPFMVYDPEYELWGWALFMLEAAVALMLLVVLLVRKPTWRGDGALLLVGLYASAQIVLESLRRDEFLRWGFVRVEEVLSAVMILLVLVCYCVRARGGKWLQKALCFALYAVMIVLCLLLEFATEGRIPFMEALSVDACYGCMALCCAVLGACVLWMRRLAACAKPIGKDCGI